MPTAPACPDLAQYKKLASGELSSSDKKALLGHLDGCDACAQRLEGLTEWDTLVELIRQAQTLGDGPGSETVARLVERVRQLRPGGEAKAPASPPIHFACPSCGKRLKVKSELAGKKGKCPHCQAVVAVPEVPATGEERSVPSSAGLPPWTLATAGAARPAGSENAGNAAAPQADRAREYENLTDFLAPPQAPDEIGRLGGYRVLKVLGAGGMGVVFQAEDPKLERKLALKAMLPALAASATARQRFLREAKTAAAVEHDHIVPIFQVGEDRGVAFIAMPFLKGEPLDEKLKRDRALPIGETLRIGREAAKGLAAAHAAGLVHRDIKPANLWLETLPGEAGLSTPGFRVKILDFGLARAAVDNAQLTQQGAIVGTPAYMAPEQAGGQVLDARCDLFSLGCVLYRMSTGHAPFKGTDTISTLISVARDNPPAPLALRPELPPALSDLVMKLLAKNPEERPESAQVVVDALQEIEAQHAASAPRAEPTLPKRKRGGMAWMDAARTRLYRPQRKRPRWPWLVGMAGVPVPVVLAGIMLFWQSPNGTVRIESNDPSVEIVFDKTGPTIRGADKEPITLRAAAHGVLVKRGEFEFETEKFTVTKGKTITLKVELLNDKIQVSAEGRLIGAKKLPTIVSGATAPNVGSGQNPAGHRDISGLTLKKPEDGVDEKSTPPPPGAIVLFDGKSLDHWTRRNDDKAPAVWKLVDGGVVEVVPGTGDIMTRQTYDGQFKLHIEFRVPYMPWARGQERGNSGIYLQGRYEVQVLDSYGLISNDVDCGAIYGVARPLINACKAPTVWQSYDIEFTARKCRDGKTVAPARVTVYQNGIKIHADQKIHVDNTVGGMGGDPCTPAPIVLQDRGSAVQFRSIWLVSVAKLPNAAQEVPAAAPADALRREQIPPYELAVAGGGDPEKEPPELVAILGDSRLNHWAPVRSLSYSPDGTTLATASFDGTVRFWEPGTGKLLRILDAHQEGLHAVSFSPDGKTLATGGEDGSVKLWEPASGRITMTFEKQVGPIVSVAFSLDGALLAGAVYHGPAGVRIWEVATGRLRSAFNKLPNEKLCRVAFSPDGKSLAAVGGRWWAPAEGQGWLRVYDLDKNQERYLLSEPGMLENVAFSPDGKVLASTGRDPTVRLWDAATGRAIRSLKGHPTWVVSASFSPDGKTLATGTIWGDIRLWEVATGKEQGILKVPGSAKAVTFSPDGKTLASGAGNHTVGLWDVARRRELPVSNSHFYFNHIAISPDGNVLASGGGEAPVRLWHVASARQRHVLQAHQGQNTWLDTNATAFSPVAGVLASAEFGWHKTIRLWDVTTGGMLKTLTGHEAGVTALAFSGDGQTLASGSYDKTVGIWDMAKGEASVRLQGHAAAVRTVALSPDGKTLASGSDDKTVRIWDLTKNQVRATLEGHQGAVRSVVFTPDGQTLISGGDDRAIKLWDLSKNQVRLTLLAHTAAVSSVALTPDGQTLASAGGDGTVRLCDAVTGRPRQTMQIGPRLGLVNQVAFTPDGRHLLTANGNGTVYVLRLSSGPAHEHHE